jgi:CSLREA domain-containing protein
VLCLAVLSAAAALAGPDPAGAATVTKTADSRDGKCDADCSLREAIEAAAPGETVTVPASATPYEVSDGLDSLVIEKDLTIAGAGARQTEVTAPGSLARPITVRSTALVVPDVTIRDMAITGGDGAGAGYSGQGGGVLATKAGGISGPKVVLERVRVEGNTATVTSKAQAVGGGVTADGVGTTLTIRDSLIAGNRAVGTGESQATGGGVATFALATAQIENTTIAGNEAVADSPTNGQSARGGGAAIAAGSSLLNVTISANSALRSTQGAILGRGGGLSASSATVRNTVIAGNHADRAGTGDCVEALAAQSLGGNVLPADCGPGPTDRTAVDAGLGALANNGGETDTMALLGGSPAIDAGTGCPPPAADQRGVSRPSGAACDAGAFEYLPNVGPGPFTTGVAKCGGKVANITGTGGRDVLKGTKKADVIVGLAGEDIIRGRGGNDRICGLQGADRILGGRGADVLIGAAGRDLLSGGPGRDALLGGRGPDELRGGPGRDKLTGGAGADFEKP